MKMSDVGFIDWLQDLIEKIVIKVIIKLKYPRVLPAKVVSVGSGIASVKLAGDDTILADLKNKTHETLSVNDNVYLFLPTGNLTNSWIMEKF